MAFLPTLLALSCLIFVTEGSMRLALSCSCDLVGSDSSVYPQYQLGDSVNLGFGANKYKKFTAENTSGVFISDIYFPFGCSLLPSDVSPVGGFATVFYDPKTYKYADKKYNKCIGITVGQFAGILTGLLVLCCCCIVFTCIYFMCCKRESTSKEIKRKKLQELQGQVAALEAMRT
jgi:hypothetical protein